MTRHLVAISDIHLCEVEPRSGLWMRYRQKPYVPSPEIGAMLEALVQRVRGDELTLVLNGDVLDFDAPRVENGESVFHDLPRDAAHGVPVAAAILRDHPEIVQGLARVLAEGHTVVFVSGNHDAHLTLPEVRSVVRDILVRAARELAGAGDAARLAGSASEEELGRRVLFRAWFYRSDEGVVFEHGHQYDSFCSFRYPMEPFGKTPGLIQPTTGSLLARRYLGRMGYFNPHVDATFMLSFFGYVRHWAQYYLWSRRSQLGAWLTGAFHTLAALLRNRDSGSRERRVRNIQSAALETGAKARAVRRHARLFAPPGEDVLWTVIRELWLDRAVLGVLAFGFVAAWVLSQRHAFGVLATLSPATLAAVELSKPKSTLEQNYRKVQRRARQVAKVHRARAVVFGHTHAPEGQWENGVFYGNTGSWSAAYRDVACTEPLFDERPLVWLTWSNGSLRGGLCAWKKGQFRHPERGRLA